MILDKDSTGEASISFEDFRQKQKGEKRMGTPSKLAVRIIKLEAEVEEELEGGRIKRAIIDEVRDLDSKNKKTVKIK